MVNVGRKRGRAEFRDGLGVSVESGGVFLSCFGALRTQLGVAFHKVRFNTL